MLTLTDLIGESAPVQTQIPSKKVSVTLRPVAYATVLQLREAIGARPTPPLVPNPNKGSLAPPEPNEQDAGYQDALAAWSRTLRICQIAVAIDYAVVIRGEAGYRFVDAADLGERTVWVSRASRELLEALTDTDLVHLGNVYDRVQGEGSSEGPTSAG